MTALIRPDAGRFDEWSAMVAEFVDGYPHGSGLPDDPHPTGTRAELDALLAKAALLANLDVELPGDRVHADHYWVTDDDGRLVGSLMFRHALNAGLLESGGHIGYSVRASRRREGHASHALGLALVRAKETGLDRVLVTCDDDNLPSASTIESQGGVLEDVRKGMRRYWIPL